MHAQEAANLGYSAWGPLNHGGHRDDNPQQEASVTGFPCAKWRDAFEQARMRSHTPPHWQEVHSVLQRCGPVGVGGMHCAEAVWLDVCRHGNEVVWSEQTKYVWRK